VSDRPADDELHDLNAVALLEFRRLLALEETLSTEWKEAVLRLTNEGIPGDLNDLQKLAEGGVDDSSQET